MEALFDTIGEIRADRVPHNCTGLGCSFCAYLDGVEERAQRQEPRRDEAWWRAANHYRIGLGVGARITADDLLKAIGEPAGSPNQIGAIFRHWQDQEMIHRVGQTASKRASNHSRRVYIWETR
jgi:hypothetical protein